MNISDDSSYSNCAAALPMTRRSFVCAIGASGAIFLLASCSSQTSNSDLHAGPVENPPSDLIDLTLTVNKKSYTFKVDPRVTLLDLLREGLGFTGTKKGCDHGQCGACTVLVNGRTLNSCLALAVLHPNAEITTVEGLAEGENLHPVQAAFIKHDAFQCGYCTPGQIMSAVALVQSGKKASVDEIKEYMSGNICRCGAYPNIVAAVMEAQGTPLENMEKSA